MLHYNIVYHTDLDGQLSLSLIRYIILKDKSFSDNTDGITIHEYPMIYSNEKDILCKVCDNINIFDNDNIFICVDYCPNKNNMDIFNIILNSCERVIIYDHHPHSCKYTLYHNLKDYKNNDDKTIELFEKIELYHDDRRCGAKIIYNANSYRDCFKENHIETVVEFVNEWDMFKDGDNKYIFNYGLSSYVTDPSNDDNIWDKLLYSDISQSDEIYKNIFQNGVAILDYNKKVANRIEKSGTEWEFMWDDKFYKCLVVNDPNTLSSLYKSYNKYDMIMTYSINNNVVTYSLRSNQSSNFNCSSFAEIHGGGGHLHASGFTDKGETLKIIGILK